ncbi:MAG TPA: chaperone NapD, partial [Sphingopyxis sp.]|nr:chaperone NapD [Sphingopyxis sp.]
PDAAPAWASAPSRRSRSPHPRSSMDDEVHIASFIVRHRPDALASIERLVAETAGAEVAAREKGRCIILHECGGTRELLACMDAVQALAGVVGVSLVYHHAEPRSALDDVLKPDAGEESRL